MATPLSTDPRLKRSLTSTSEHMSAMRQQQYANSPHGQSVARMKASPKPRKFKHELDKPLPKVDLNSPVSPDMDDEAAAALARARAAVASVADFEAPDFSTLFAKAAALNEKYADVLDDGEASPKRGAPATSPVSASKARKGGAGKAGSPRKQRPGGVGSGNAAAANAAAAEQGFAAAQPSPRRPTSGRTAAAASPRTKRASSASGEAVGAGGGQGERIGPRVPSSGAAEHSPKLLAKRESSWRMSSAAPPPKWVPLSKGVAAAAEIPLSPSDRASRVTVDEEKRYGELQAAARARVAERERRRREQEEAEAAKRAEEERQAAARRAQGEAQAAKSRAAAKRRMAVKARTRKAEEAARREAEAAARAEAEERNRRAAEELRERAQARVQAKAIEDDARRQMQARAEQDERDRRRRAAEAQQRSAALNRKLARETEMRMASKQAEAARQREEEQRQIEAEVAAYRRRQQEKARAAGRGFVPPEGVAVLRRTAQASHADDRARDAQGSQVDSYPSARRIVHRGPAVPIISHGAHGHGGHHVLQAHAHLQQVGHAAAPAPAQTFASSGSPSPAPVGATAGSRGHSGRETVSSSMALAPSRMPDSSDLTEYRGPGVDASAGRVAPAAADGANGSSAAAGGSPIDGGESSASPQRGGGARSDAASADAGNVPADLTAPASTQQPTAASSSGRPSGDARAAGGARSVPFADLDRGSLPQRPHVKSSMTAPERGGKKAAWRQKPILLGSTDEFMDKARVQSSKALRRPGHERWRAGSQAVVHPNEVALRRRGGESGVRDARGGARGGATGGGGTPASTPGTVLPPGGLLAIPTAGGMPHAPQAAATGNIWAEDGAADARVRSAVSEPERRYSKQQRVASKTRHRADQVEAQLASARDARDERHMQRITGGLTPAALAGREARSSAPRSRHGRAQGERAIAPAAPTGHGAHAHAGYAPPHPHAQLHAYRMTPPGGDAAAVAAAAYAAPLPPGLAVQPLYRVGPGQPVMPAYTPEAAAAVAGGRYR